MTIDLNWSRDHSFHNSHTSGISFGLPQMFSRIPSSIPSIVRSALTFRQGFSTFHQYYAKSPSYPLLIFFVNNILSFNGKKSLVLSCLFVCLFLFLDISLIFTNSLSLNKCSSFVAAASPVTWTEELLVSLETSDRPPAEVASSLKHKLFI